MHGNSWKIMEVCIFFAEDGQMHGKYHSHEIMDWVGPQWLLELVCTERMPFLSPKQQRKYSRKLKALVLIQDDHSSDLICSWSTNPLLMEAETGSPWSVLFRQTPHTAYNTSAFIASFSFTKNRQERGKFVSLLVVSRLESIQLQAGFTPDQGLCPTPLGANPHTSIIGSCSTITIFSPKRTPFSNLGSAPGKDTAILTVWCPVPNQEQVSQVWNTQHSW